MMNIINNECSGECEQSLKNLIQSLKHQFKEHYTVFKSTVGAQKEIIDAMWVLSQRFLILTRGAICVRPYPREPTDRDERETSAEFKLKKKLLHESNIKLNASLYSIKEACIAFDQIMSKVDASLPNQIVEGKATRRPICYYIELFADLFYFFHQIQNKLNLLGSFMMVEDIISILDYRHFIESDQVIHEYFENCKVSNTK